MSKWDRSQSVGTGIVTGSGEGGRFLIKILSLAKQTLESPRIRKAKKPDIVDTGVCGGSKVELSWSQNRTMMAGLLRGEDPFWKLFYEPYHI